MNLAILVKLPIMMNLGILVNLLITVANICVQSCQYLCSKLLIFVFKVANVLCSKLLIFVFKVANICGQSC